MEKEIVTAFVATVMELSAKYRNMLHEEKVGFGDTLRPSRKLCLMALTEAPVSHKAATVLTTKVTLRHPHSD